VAVYPLMALGAVHIANDNTFAQLVTLPSYYTDLLFAFAFVYAIGFYIRWVIIRLDAKASWSANAKKRLIQQSLIAIVVPCVLLVLTESIYLVYGLNIPLKDSSIAYLELPISFVFLVVINLCYYVLFLRAQTAVPMGRPTVYLPFIVSKGYKRFSIDQVDVAYFAIESSTTFLVTHQNERFVVTESIESLEKKTDPIRFFKLNRQILASRASIESVENTPTRKVQVKLNPVFAEEIFVSKANATEFQRWWRKSASASA
jgi:hypothetical protein